MLEVSARAFKDKSSTPLAAAAVEVVVEAERTATKADQSWALKLDEESVASAKYQTSRREVAFAEAVEAGPEQLWVVVETE